MRGFAPDTVELEILSSSTSVSEPGVRVTLYVGYPKQDKLETIVQKAVELGAVRVVPFFSRYCVAAPKRKSRKTCAITASPLRPPSRADGAWCRRWNFR